MTRHKDLKRLVRTRMNRTGESYTAARAHVVQNHPAPSPTPAASPGLSDKAVKAGTGRDWAEWIRWLDRAGAVHRPHPDIARLLQRDEGLSPWWAQTVTVGYERIKGLRQIGQKRSGSWEAVRSRTYPVPVRRLYAAFGPRNRGRWLAEPGVRIRTSIANRSIRFSWPDGTSVHAVFIDKGGSRSTVNVQHAKLASAADRDARKTWWGDRLDRLASYLSGESTHG